MGSGGGLVVVDFSEQGNSAAFRVEGWSGQESDRVWGIGSRSVLRIPLQPSHRTTVLEVEIAPLQVPPLITGQIVRIRVNGTLIGVVRLEFRSMMRNRSRSTLPTRLAGDRIRVPGFLPA
jgi:hypothetical protein